MSPLVSSLSLFLPSHTLYRAPSLYCTCCCCYCCGYFPTRLLSISVGPSPYHLTPASELSRCRGSCCGGSWSWSPLPCLGRGGTSAVDLRRRKEGVGGGVRLGAGGRWGAKNDRARRMGNCGTREESAVVVAHAPVQQLHMFQPVKSNLSERKHNRSLSDLTDPSTPQAIEDSMNISIYTNVILFTLYELETITKSFRSDYVLGEGGFGTVFKGYIDENVRVGLKSLPVAVKVLNKDGLQGHREWLTEVNFLGQLRHSNLVKLIGYCCEDDHRLLVYEFMFRGSLENHLFRKTAAPLSWSTRMMIALGAAKGLAFLHNAERPVIYRDFKTSNILLDSDYTAKLSDFGLAKLGPQGDETHVSTRVMGTYGYAAPEYVMTGHLTARSDVYSFGVVLLELLTGRKAVDKMRPSKEQSLVDWARPMLNDKRKLLQIIDPRLEEQYSVRAAQKACSLAYYCLSPNPKARPLMSDVVETLEPLQESRANEVPMRSTVGSTGLPECRSHRRPTGNSPGCRSIPSPKCSPGAVPPCRVR